jgi:hypothetical protein
MAATVTTRRRSRGRPAARRRGAPRTAAATAILASPALTALDRARRSGGPIDRALYACGCGETFTATVSTTVGCPGCGETQTW